MEHFQYQAGELYAEQVSLQQIAAQFGTPCYVYSRTALTQQWQAFDQALAGRDHLVCFAVKANPNLAVLNVLARLGSGFDIVSGGELARVIAAGGDPAKVVFSGVGKQVWELEEALTHGIRCFNVESSAELERLNQVATRMQRTAPVSLRVNPDVDAKTHPYISTGLKQNKFGVEHDQALDWYRQAAALPHIRVVGIDCHIGSQLTELTPFLDALVPVLALVDQLAAEGIVLEHLDLGGGLGVRYQDERPPLPAEYVAALLDRLGERPQQIMLEPGRAIAANAGVLLTQVEYLKSGEEKQFAIVDAAMNDLLRPALYDAWQPIVPVMQHSDAAVAQYDVVGPVCETGDFLGKDRPLAISTGNLLAVGAAGAYGFSMASQYNSRPRPAEVMVDGNQVFCVRPRESVADLFASESTLPDQ
ncbi:MAG: diaminopimelate decarboxylase [Pseudomonadota bacterium]